MTQSAKRGTGTTPRGSAARQRHVASDLVPSRRQYLDLKRDHPESLLLYRMGDFYEAFDEDARKVAADARITLTSRNFGRSGRVPMAGIPYHALNHYLGRLLRAGHTVAIAEQISEPGRGLVERAVTRVLTPGTVAEPGLLPAGESRYLAALVRQPDRAGLAWVDVSTGEFAALELVEPDAARRLDEELTRINPAEMLVPDDRPDDASLPGHRTRLERWHFEAERAAAVLRERFGVRSLAPYGIEGCPAALGAAGAVLAYLGRTNSALLPLLTGLRVETPGASVGLDAATRRNLELTRSLRTGGARGSLLHVLDESRTPMGARALRRLVGQPLRDLAVLQRRQAVVGALVDAPALRAHLATLLDAVGDLERQLGRVTQGAATVRDLLQLGLALRATHLLLQEVAASGKGALVDFVAPVDACADVSKGIEAAVLEGEDGVARIRRGFAPELDAAIDAVGDTRRWLVELEASERERTGIRSLKVGFNKVFGYYIEVTRPNLPAVPPEYVRKQTIASGERFVTAELKQAEAELLAADETIAALEQQAVARVAAGVTAVAARLRATAGQVALLDALRSLAEVADRGGWVAPELSDGGSLSITGGRHPVVEAGLEGEPFIPNDCHLGGGCPRTLLVTGPNMGGKSTFLRQVALIVVLAQIGAFVPARAARIGLVDRIFTRIGAQDDLAGGASTFMVEMLETATILHQATSRSLLILDEIGRGTSTDDGLAIARAVLEDIHGRIGARTLFATHYLELTDPAAGMPGLGNVHLAALETQGRVVFLYAVRPGPADRAHGIHVARLAGLPPWVADRAESVLASLSQAPARERLPEPAPEPRSLPGRIAEDGEPAYQLTLDGFPAGPRAADQIAEELAALDLMSLSPREALDWLFAQRARLGGPL